jgi:hypothetical protein
MTRKSPLLVWYITCQPTCKSRSLRMLRLCLHGKILHPWREMNGYAGLNPLKSRKRETRELREQVTTLQMESADLVAGLAVLIVRVADCKC